MRIISHFGLTDPTQMCSSNFNFSFWLTYIHCSGILKIALRISLPHLIWIFALSDSQYFKQSTSVILQHLLPLSSPWDLLVRLFINYPDLVFCLKVKDGPFMGILNGFSAVCVLVSYKMAWLSCLSLRVCSFCILGKWF